MGQLFQKLEEEYMRSIVKLQTTFLVTYEMKVEYKLKCIQA